MAKDRASSPSNISGRTSFKHDTDIHPTMNYDKFCSPLTIDTVKFIKGKIIIPRISVSRDLSISIIPAIFQLKKYKTESMNKRLRNNTDDNVSLAISKQADVTGVFILSSRDADRRSVIIEKIRSSPASQSWKYYRFNATQLMEYRKDRIGIGREMISGKYGVRCSLPITRANVHKQRVK